MTKTEPDAPRHAIPIVVALDVYHLRVPLGAVSRNDDFWKHVDEQAIDVANYDLLLKNGVRAGVAHDRDWGWFKGVLAAFPSAQSSRGRTQPGREGYIELDVQKNLPYENLFWLDDRGNPVGRTFERCENLLGVSFVASTHRTGDVVVKVCPIVRCLQRYFPVTILNNDEPDIETVRPERLYDLRLQTKLPINHFLIISPAPDAHWPTSLGNVFFTSQGKTEPQEDVYLLVPRTFRADEPVPDPGKTLP